MARRRAEDYDDKRLAILSRSAELFAEAGYARTSMADIADACGISKGLFYHYYLNKEKLLFDLLERHLTRCRDAVASAASAPGPPEARLRDMVTALLLVYADADALHKVQMNDLKILPEDQQDELKTIERAIVEMLAGVLGQINPALARNRRLLKPVTMSLLGMVNWHHTWFRPSGALSRQAYGALAASIIVAGVRQIDQTAS